MLFLSHLKALLWKNWLLWRRKFIGSICELIFPLIVVGITVGIRSTSDTIVQEGGPFIDEGHLFTTPGDDNQFYQDLSALTENEPFLMETLGGNYWTVIGEDRAEVEAMKDALQPFVELFQTQSQRQLTFLDDMLTQDDLFDFVKNPSYGKDSEFDTLFFAVGLPTDPEDNPHEFTIFQPDEGPMLIPSMNWDRIFSIPDFDSYYLYSRNGFAGLQSFIANYILRKETGLEEASVDTYIALGYLPRFLQDNYLKEDGRASFPVFILLIFIIPLFRLVNSLTGEKSSRAREGMKIMGLNDTPYWVSWFIYYSGIWVVISIISGLMLTFLIFENSSAFFIILWLFLYGMTFFSFGVLVASIMHKPINACIFVTLLHFIPYFIFIPIKEPEVSDGVRLGLSIVPTVAMAISSQTIFDLEQSIAGLTGSTLFSSVSKFPVGIAIVSFLINIFGQFLLGLYLDNVLPKQFGKRQHPCFMFKKSYWFGASVAAESGTNQRLLDEEDPEQNNDSENFEVAPPNVRQLEKSGECMKVRNLRKVYGDGKVAIDDLSLTMYKDQIFALLGHNGAGKTTTFSILMGLYQPSGGSASVFNINMVDQSDQVRKNLGVCPQFDILFDTLTPEEHLRLYWMFKGVPSEEIDNQIEKTLKDVDLLSKRKSFAKNLSGGQKRKLSVGIAMIGGSKLILLDEPTSGMDLTARRKIWDMLKQNKKDRIILLTTHFMDEADILGDRIAIMTSGKVKCCGGSLFLKKKFGVGYNLVIAKETKLPNPDIEKFVFSRIENCIKLSEVSSEVTFQMPMTESHKFESFFTDLDNSLEDLKIKSYGVGVTTLEEVFLKVGYQKGEEIEEMEYSKHEEAEGHQTKSQLNYSGNSDAGGYSVAEDHEKNVFWLHYYALCVKNFLVPYRHLKSFLIEVFVPIIFILIGLFLSNLKFFKDAQPYYIDMSALPSGNKLFLSTLQPDLPEFQKYSDAIDQEIFNPEGIDFPQDRETLLENFLEFEQNMFHEIGGYDNRVRNSGNQFVHNIDLDEKRCGVVATVNAFGRDTVPIHMNKMLQTWMRVLLDQPNFELRFRSHPLPLTNESLARAKNMGGSIISLLFAIAFAVVPTGIAATLVKERESNVKHQQMISGASKLSYWLSTYTIDLIRGYFPITFGIIMIFVFDVDLPFVWVHFILFGLVIHPFTYATTFWFKKHGVAQLMTIIINIGLGALIPIAILILQTIESTQNVANTLRWIPRIFPIFSMINGIVQISIRNLIGQQKGGKEMPHPLDMSISGGDALFLGIGFFFWWGVTLLSEGGIFTKVFQSLKCKRVVEDFSRRTENVKTDSDVLKEELRCEQLNPKECSVLVNGLRKGFTVNGEPFVAVKNISFGLENGEWFALLGVNGAGKSTTFKSMSGDITPSDGKIYIEGNDISSINEFSEARKLIGYCPQVDALFDGLTVFEHLVFYSRIKGILAHKRDSLIQKVMDELDLESFKHVRCEKLSGGNKRKLSVAMAMIGNPPIIFLDEPSTGMDPRAKRFMWTIISRISTLNKKSTIILTTHSMEEAEALCTKMGIMVRGRFKCFGSSQEIKDKFGTGYEIEVKVKWPTDEEALNYIKDKGLDSEKYVTLQELEETMNTLEKQKLLVIPQFSDLKSDVEKDGSISMISLCQWALLEESGCLIKDELEKSNTECKILEHHNNFYKFRLERGLKSLGFYFGFMEKLKEKVNFSEYGVSQSTLEQIFNTFAREDED